MPSTYYFFARRALPMYVVNCCMAEFSQRPTEEVLREEIQRLQAQKLRNLPQDGLRYIDEPQNRLELLLKAHLFLESILIQLIEAAVPAPENLQIDRTSFGEKVSFAAALAALPPAFVAPLMRLHRIRNRVSHELDAPITGAEVREVKLLVPERMREVLETLEKEQWPEDDDLRDLRAVATSLALTLLIARSNIEFHQENRDLLIQEAAVTEMKRLARRWREKQQ